MEDDCPKTGCLFVTGSCVRAVCLLRCDFNFQNLVAIWFIFTDLLVCGFWFGLIAWRGGPVYLKMGRPNLHACQVCALGDTFVNQHWPGVSRPTRNNARRVVSPTQGWIGGYLQIQCQTRHPWSVHDPCLSCFIGFEVWILPCFLHWHQWTVFCPKGV